MGVKLQGTATNRMSSRRTLVEFEQDGDHVTLVLAEDLTMIKATGSHGDVIRLAIDEGTAREFGRFLAGLPKPPRR